MKKTLGISLLLFFMSMVGITASANMTEEYKEQYPEFVAAMCEAFDCGYIDVLGEDYGKTYQDSSIKYGRFSVESIMSLHDGFSLDEGSYQYKKYKDIYGLCIVYDTKKLEAAIEFRFGVFLEDLLRAGIDNMLYADEENIVMQPYGRGDNWPGAEIVIDEIRMLSENRVYCQWHMKNAEYNPMALSGNMYAILEKGNVYGKELISYKYLSVYPPTQEVIRNYSAVPVNDIKVLLNGIEIEFDQPPIIKDDRTLVPMRAIFEAMGCEVEWDDGMVDVWKDDEYIMTLWIDDYEMYLAQIDEYIELDVPPQIVNDRTLVPVRAISESMGAKVKWDGDTRTVDIMYWSGYSGTTIYEDYYRNHPDILNFGLFLEDNPHMADRDGYIYSYTNETNIDSIIDGYIEELEFEGFELVDVYDENGAIHYIMDNGEWELLIIDDYLLEHIEIWID